MRHFALIGTVLALAAGCTASGPDGEFAEGQGQAPVALPSYPDSGEWGTAKQTVIPNWSFIGYANSEDPNLQGLQLIQLADFYNPHGYEYAACVEGGGSDCAEQFPDALFPEGSFWGAGQPKPRALSVGQSAVWCGPCNMEAKSILPGEYAKYKPLGGHFIVALIDGPKPGVSATYGDITKWTQKYEVAYSLVTDPSGLLPQLFEPSLPSNAIIRTSDMRILRADAGAPSAAYWLAFEKVLESAN